MSELRQNLATKEWVIISPERAKKPNRVIRRIESHTVSDREHDPDCPFCPGNEDKYSIIERHQIEGENGKWRVRVIDNKYKVLDDFPTCPIMPDRYETEGIYHRLSGCGSHELVIDTPVHNRRIVDLTREELEDVISAIMTRYSAFSENPNNLITFIFKNFGVLAGQTQPHSHLQIVGSRVIPLYTRALLHEAEKHFDTLGACVICDMLRYETEARERMIYENGDFTAFVPYAAGAEHETWIVPRRHRAGLQDVKGDAVRTLADIMHAIFDKYLNSLHNPDFNFVFRAAPYPLSDVPYYHWYIQLLPRTKIIGGFERGTRIQVNTVLPEESARMLRECGECRIEG